MADITTLGSHRRDPRHRFAVVAVLVVAFMAAMAAEASATVRFEHHTDPAGDPAVFTYNLLRDTEQVKSTAQLSGSGAYASFGPGPGTWIMQAVPPAGWRVAAIRCVEGAVENGPKFQIDVARGRVTVQHVGTEHQVCAFTSTRITASGGGSGSGATTGVAPTPVFIGTNPTLPARSAVSRVTPGRRSATATVRLARRAVIRATLLNGRRVLATRRIQRAAGVHRLQVTVPRAVARRLRAQGKTRATLRLRVVIVERGGTTRVFNTRVRVRL